MNSRSKLSLALALLLWPMAAFAGPPLICHTFNIGDARSLPFQSTSWSATDPNYNPQNLVNDVAALLTPTTPVIVRMETLRRAAIYTRHNAALADALLGQLQTRARGLAEASPAAWLAKFDVGYLAEIYREAVDMSPHAGTDAMRFDVHRPDIDGYGFVIDAIRHGGGPEMEFAAAMITMSHRDRGHEEHVRRAIAGARPGSLLMTNLAVEFPDAMKLAANRK